MTKAALFSRDLLNSLPDALGLMILGFVVLCLLVALLAKLLLAGVRRYFGTIRRAEDSREVAVVSAMIVTLFALLLAFSIVTLYDQRRNAQEAAEREASDLAQIDRDSVAFGETPSRRILSAVNYYFTYVTQCEFTAMRDGDLEFDQEQTSKLVTKIFVAVNAFEPRTESQSAFYSVAVSQLNDLVAQRRARLASVGSGLPTAFAFLIVVTGLTSIFLLAFVVMSNEWVEWLLVSSVGLIIACGLLTAFLLEYPYSGPLRITSEPFIQGFQTDIQETGIKWDCSKPLAGSG